MQEADTVLGEYERYCTPPPIASIPPALRSTDPKRCSSAALVWARHKGMAAAYALGAQRQQRQLRVLHVPLPFLCGWVGHMMECTAVALDKGRRVVPRRRLTYTSSIDVFLALYEHRCVSLPCVRGVDGECNLTDELLNSYLEAVALGAPNSKANSTACCKHWRWTSGSGVH